MKITIKNYIPYIKIHPSNFFFLEKITFNFVLVNNLLILQNIQLIYRLYFCKFINDYGTILSIKPQKIQLSKIFLFFFWLPLLFIPENLDK